MYHPFASMTVAALLAPEATPHHQLHLTMLDRIDTVYLPPLLSRRAEDPSLLACWLLLHTALVAVDHPLEVFCSAVLVCGSPLKPGLCVFRL